MVFALILFCALDENQSTLTHFYYMIVNNMHIYLESCNVEGLSFYAKIVQKWKPMHAAYKKFESKIVSVKLRSWLRI